MMDIKERIKQFADSKGIPIYKFESTAGLSNGYVNGIRKGIGSEKLSDILRAKYDSSSPNLLITFAIRLISRLLK